MSYARAILQRDVRKEEAALQKKATKKGLWGSIGRTLGGLAATAITGGAAAPWALGLAAGTGSLLGGAVGSKAAGKLTGGKFFRDERADLQSELGAFGSENLMSSLKSGLTAGIGQKLKLAKEGAPTAAKGLDFGESLLGRGLAKGTAISDVKPSVVMKGDAPVWGDIEDPGRYAQLNLMSQGQGPGLFRQTAEGGAPILEGETLSEILERQSDAATAVDKSFTMYGGGGRGIDPSIKFTGNEFIDRQLGIVGESASAVDRDSWQSTIF